MGATVRVVGVGADGWDGLSAGSRTAVLEAEVLLGGRRHLALVPAGAAVREPWPSPLLPRLGALLERYADRRVVVLASGDPLVSGIGGTLVDLLGPGRVEVLPAVSSVALARARLGWSAETCDVVSLVGRDLDGLRRWLAPDRRLLVLSSDGATPGEVARLLVEHGCGSSVLTVLARLGAADESRTSATAERWPGGASPALHVLAVDVRPGPGGAPLLGTGPGLPDDAFEHDGQLTKRDARAIALSRLVPTPGQLLWDVGAGAGSVAVEWLRADPRCRAVAVEAVPERAARVARNARRLGVPGLEVREGTAPDALVGLPEPHAVFVGGGAGAPGVLASAWQALRPGGRLVVHAVTLETEGVVTSWRARVGGDLTRLSVEHAEPLGSFTGWRPARPVVQWAVTR